MYLYENTEGGDQPALKVLVSRLHPFRMRELAVQIYDIYYLMQNNLQYVKSAYIFAPVMVM